MTSGFEDRKGFDDFVRLVIKEAKVLMHDAYGIVTDITYRQVLKNNNQIYDGLVFKPAGIIEKPAPTIYINDAFTRYRDQNESLESIVHDITEAGYQAMQREIEMPDISREGFEKHVRLAVVNAAANEEFLSDTPHFKICEDTLAAYPRYIISNEASLKITNSICTSDKVMMSPNDVLSIGLANTKNLDFRVLSMSDMLHGIFEDTGRSTEELDLVMEEAQPQMVVLTTMDGVYGSSVLLSENSLEKAKEMLGSNEIILIPSSTEEIIAIADNGQIDPEVIAEMIREVNMTHLKKEQILGYEPMRWGINKKLSLAISEPKHDITHEFEPKIDKSFSMAMV